MKSELQIAIQALETIANKDYPYRPITFGSAKEFYEQTAAEALSQLKGETKDA